MARGAPLAAAAAQTWSARRRAAAGGWTGRPPEGPAYGGEPLLCLVPREARGDRAEAAGPSGCAPLRSRKRAGRGRRRHRNAKGTRKIVKETSRGDPFVAVRRFAPATARVEGGGGHHLPGAAALWAGDPWDFLLRAARRFAPATARVEGGGGQARPRRLDLPRGQARQSRAYGAHGAARGLECSRGRRPARLGSVGPAPDGPAQRAVLGGHAGQPRAMGSRGLARRRPERPRGLRRDRMGSAGARDIIPNARRAHLRHGRPEGAGPGDASRWLSQGAPCWEVMDGSLRGEVSLGHGPARRPRGARTAAPRGRQGRSTPLSEPLTGAPGTGCAPPWLRRFGDPAKRWSLGCSASRQDPTAW